MATKHGAYKAKLGKGYFVVGYRVGKEDLPEIRKLLHAWRSNKLPCLVKLAALVFEDRVKRTVDPPSFLHFFLGKSCIVNGTPASLGEIEREFPEGIDDGDHIIRLAIS